MAKSNSLLHNSSNVETFEVAPGKQDILHIKRKILKVIESLLEENISAELLIKSCKMLSKNDYDDVIEERIILCLCGYPLCSNYVKVPHQKYCIISKVNRVYDIKERKCFCSNKCYKASCYLKEQLSEIPIWFQDIPVTVKLLSDEENCGSSGNLVVFEKIAEKTDENDVDVKNENTDWFTESDKKLMSDDIMNSIAGRITNLEITEKNDFSFSENVEIQSPSKVSSDKKVILELLNTDFSDDEDKDNYLVNEDKKRAEKFMPLPVKKKINRSLLVEPHSEISNNSSSSAPISLQSVKNLLKEWVTDKTLVFLFGEKIDTENNDDFITTYTNDIISCSLSSISKDNEVKNVHDSLPTDCNSANSLSDRSDEPSQINLYMERVKLYLQGENLNSDLKKSEKSIKFKTGKNIKMVKNENSKKTPKKKVSFESENNEIEEKFDPTSMERLVLPTVDSLSQSALRQQVVCTQFKKAFLVILPFIGMHYQFLGSLVPELVSSFRLSASNVVYKPHEWKLISIVILRMLSRSTELKDRISEEVIDDSKICNLLMKTGFSKDFSLQEIDQIIQNIL